MYRINNDMVSNVFKEMFTLNSSVNNYRTRHANYPCVPKFSKATTQRSIKITGVHIWNNILDNIETNINISSFKNQLDLLVRSARK